MILPTKYIPASDSVLGRAGVLLTLRASNPTVSELWYSYRSAKPEATFDSFAESLTLLYLLGAVALDGGVLQWEV